LQRHENLGRATNFQTSFQDTKEALLQQQKWERAQTRQYSWWRRRRRRQTTGSYPTERFKPVPVPVDETLRNINSRVVLHNLGNNHNDDNSTSHYEQQPSIPVPLRFQGQFALTVKTNNNNNISAIDNTHVNSLLARRQSKIPRPSLFLQEMAHLVSLLSAMALSTLRNDDDRADLPVAEYVPGKPWPAADPDQLSREARRAYDEDRSLLYTWLSFSLGLTRTQKHRTLYNHARPFGVLGGVSDREIALLKEARGPYAKVALCSLWYQEFITREYMNGSTGTVPSPLITRLYMNVSDGMAGYNQARKLCYIPFPFVHAQTSAFFSAVITFIFPLLFVEYVAYFSFAIVLNFCTVLCFLGLYCVALELEAPFVNAPNDLPLVTMQAQLNEALVSIYAGYNPDLWWDVKLHARKKKSMSPVFDDDNIAEISVEVEEDWMAHEEDQLELHLVEDTSIELSIHHSTGEK
jgi:hypothetical protein